MKSNHTPAANEAKESLIQDEADALRIIHITRMKPQGKSAKLIPNLISKGFCTDGGKRSKLTDRGMAALLSFIKSKKEQ